ncbi:hypothetical protein HMPREF2913_07335 [Staphylococcus sp. HMSC065A08]|nr:hypothetical protein HMPREF2913_07335 [Staphylococcus sp. HMSC065A08]
MKTKTNLPIDFSFISHSYERILRNKGLFILISIQTIVHYFIIFFINHNNSSVFGIITTVIMFTIFNLFINKNSSSKRYIIKKWSVWNESCLIAMSLNMIIYYLFIEPYDDRTELIHLNLSNIFSFSGILAIIFLGVLYFLPAILLFKFFKDK